MADITTSSIVAAPQQEFYNRMLLKRALPYLTHSKFAQMKPVPLKSGDQPKFRRYNSLTPSTAALSEGVEPTAQTLSVTEVTGQLYQYGSFVKITDYVDYTSQDPVLSETSALLGEAMGNSLDRVYRDVLAAGTSVYYANAVAGRSSIIAKLAAADLDKILRALANNNAKYWHENPIAGSDKVGTTPIAPAYFAIVDPYTVYDLRAVLTTSFIEPHKYPNPSVALTGEVGSYKNLRFIESTNAKVFADSGGSATAASLKYTTATSACDVHTMLIFGKDSHGITELSGKGAEIIVHDRKTAGGALEQYSTAGYKATTGIKILNDNFMYRYEFGVSV